MAAGVNAGAKVDLAAMHAERLKRSEEKKAAAIPKKDGSAKQVAAVEKVVKQKMPEKASEGSGFWNWLDGWISDGGTVDATVKFKDKASRTTKETHVDGSSRTVIESRETSGGLGFSFSAKSLTEE
jgi:hypothetical protein